MRIAIAAVLSVAILAPGMAIAADPPEAAAGLEVVKAHMRTQRNVNIRKVKVSAEGNVCGTYGTGADRDTEFLWNKSTGKIWIAEMETEQNSLFGYGDPMVIRSTERADYQTWKACQKGK